MFALLLCWDPACWSNGGGGGCAEVIRVFVSHVQSKRALEKNSRTSFHGIPVALQLLQSGATKGL